MYAQVHTLTNYDFAEYDNLHVKIKSSPVLLVGLGPHAKRIYLHYLKMHNGTPNLIIDLVSKKDEVIQYLKENSIESDVFFVSDNYRDGRELPDHVQVELLKKIQEHKIQHAIISTEPKSHYAYVKFLLESDVNVLLDKPITAPTEVSTREEKARLIEKDYHDLVSIYLECKKRNPALNFLVQCQRRLHKGYLVIHKLLTETVKEYGIPITQIDIYHCDGMWNMPDEFVYRENHPYKYGYGKLMHSGYHFIDLLIWLYNINNQLVSKQANNIKLSTAFTRADDFMTRIAKDDYLNLFQTNKVSHIFDNFMEYTFDKYGEVDISSLIQFCKDKNSITTCTLNLLQSGFSRRAWIYLPEDTYKGNGRVRHEHVNIHIGPLLNIQIHSYQSKEIKDRELRVRGEVGSVEHFDIYIFRNTELIGGKVFEKIVLSDIVEDENPDHFIGYNEQAREKMIINFLNGNQEYSHILDHELSIKILSKMYLSMCKDFSGDIPFVKFDI